MEHRTESLEEPQRVRGAAWLLIIPGATILGMSFGLWLEQPGYGLLSGLGSGMLVWGLIVALREGPKGKRAP